MQYRPVPATASPITLHAGDAVATIRPDAGGRVEQISVGDVPLLIDVADRDRIPLNWGAYPMAPWVGRVRDRRFTFDGIEYELATNHHDDGPPAAPHSIHGTTFTRAWSVVDASPASATLECPLDWPLGGIATEHLALAPGALTWTIELRADHGDFPAEVGWHPWFRAPDRLDFAPTGMYRRDERNLPVGDPVPPTPPPWDDCFTNTEPVVLHYDRAPVATVTVAADCDHWVVFDAVAGALCVEPQSGPPDALNRAPHVVTPATPLRRTMTIAWAPNA